MIDQGDDSKFADLIRKKQETVTIVGSGITALMSAWEAQKAGYKVNVISQSPDPRKKTTDDQPQQSSTFDGQDQRYITLFEGHPYLELIEYVQKVYPDIGNDFMKSVLEGGVLAKPFEEFSPRAQKWLRKREKINNELKGGNERLKAKIKTLFTAYAEENRAAMEKWYNFIGELLEAKEADPRLAKQISVSRDGIMRLYDNAEVLETSALSHKVGGVFKRQYTPEELKDEKNFPAYAAGVDNNFIQGGSVEMHGLTLGVKTIGKAMMDILEKRGVQFTFEKRVEKPVVEKDKVVGLKIAGEDKLVKSKHYIFHPGAMGLQELYKEIAPGIQNTIAAMEGYWITIDGAGEIVKQMRGKPNKVHGKQTLKALLDKVDAKSRKKFTEKFSEVGVTDFEKRAPIVDFNIMPIYSQEGEKVTLGVGSGYVFEGLAEPGEKGNPAFQEDEKSKKFVLALMELWLEVLYGKELLNTGKMKILPKGCKRSWTVDDREVDRNILTVDGGVLELRGGGNTGDTTKSTFVAKYNIDLLQAVEEKQAEGKVVTTDTMRRLARGARKSLRRKAEEVDFAKLTEELDAKFAAAERPATIAGILNRPESPDSAARIFGP